MRAGVAEAEGLLALVTDRVDAAVLDAAPQLRAIANMAVGTDNIDLEAAAERGIPVGNTPDVLTDATADLAFALLLALARKIVPGAAKVRDGEWRTWEPAGDLGADLAGATLGVVGWGRIGQAVARRAEGFGMEVDPQLALVRAAARRAARAGRLRVGSHAVDAGDAAPDRH